MNGRVYDPVLARFLSADPNIDGVSDAQGFNRYSYVGNGASGLSRAPLPPFAPVVAAVR